MDINETLHTYGYFLPKRLEKLLLIDGEACTLTLQLPVELLGETKISGDWDTMVDIVPKEKLTAIVQGKDSLEVRDRREVKFLTVEAPREYALREAGEFQVTATFEDNEREVFHFRGRRLPEPKEPPNTKSLIGNQVTNTVELA